MKAIIQSDYSGIKGLTIEEKKMSSMTPLSAIVKNKYIPVLPYDWMTEDGLLKGMRSVRLPMVIGYGFSGIVEKTGVLRDKKLIGKKVIGVQPTGSAKEYINSQVPPLLFKVPKNVELSDAVTIIGGADAAMHAISALRVTNKDVVLITGASGGVGSYLSQLLKLAGAKVIAIGNGQNYNYILENGADYFIDYQKDFLPQTQKILTPNKVIDTVGSSELLKKISETFESLDILSLSLTQFKPVKNNQTFRFSNGSIGIRGYRRLLKLMENKKIHANIQKVYNFNNVREAQLESKNHHSRGRILLEF